MESTVVKADNYENYLLVEGDEDKHVFTQLLGQYQIFEKFKIKHENFEIKGHNGIEYLLNLRTLRNYFVVDESRRFGIVLDADTDLAARWKQIKAICETIGYHDVPKSPSPDGTLLSEEGLPLVGIWLMPDNRASGMMEDFIGWLVPRDDLLWPMAGDIVQKVIERERRFRESYISKACIHTWLAWQKDPGTSLGMSINKHYIDVNAPHALQFIAWVRKLFDLESA